MAPADKSIRNSSISGENVGATSRREPTWWQTPPVKDTECVAFLQWALPRLRLGWPGYRKVRRQVCKRIARRIKALGLEDIQAYRARLEVEPSEWTALDGLTRITISRFYRERDAFDYLCETVLPSLGATVSPAPVRIWSAGCAAGEEPYTLAIAAHDRGISVRIVATDADAHQLERARWGRYRESSLKDLPPHWRASAFEHEGDDWVLEEEVRRRVAFVPQDIREIMPEGRFHLILCRYLVFTYFDASLQRELATRLRHRIAPGGFVVLGKHERWPVDVSGLVEVRPGLRVYERVSASASRKGDPVV